jgi:HEAT repeat protein
MGSKSVNADIRSSIWASMRGVDDASLVQPLLDALARDPDANARMQAALNLNTFLDRPGVREALLRAATQDSSKDAAMVCCVLTVREAAERASVADTDFKAWVNGRLLDSSLPNRSRLMNLQGGAPDGRFLTLSVADFGPDAAAAVFDIGRYETNPGVRRMAWNALQHAAPNDAYVPVLLGDLTSSPDEYVRASAAQVLTSYTGNPQVRAAFERARSDPSMAVRRVVTAGPGN